MSRTGEKADLLQLSLYVLLSELGVTIEAFRRLNQRQSRLVNGQMNERHQRGFVVRIRDPGCL